MRPLYPPLEELHVTSSFGPRLHPVTKIPHHHAGVDYRCAIGTPVRAPGRGRVVRIDRDGIDKGAINGNAVFVRLLEGELELELVAYLHLSQVSVLRGDQVDAGHILGLSGASGRVSGPHLHVTLYAHRTQPEPVDPHPYFAAWPVRSCG